MKIKSIFLACTALAAVSFSQAQTIPASRKVDWSNAGYGSAIPTTYGATINITSYGGNGTDLLPDDAALTAALAAANPNVLTMIYFPTGKYIFNQEITILQGNIVIKGAGPSYTKFHFRNTSGQCIAILGSESGSDIPISSGALKGNTALTLSSAASIGINNYIEIKRDMLASQQCTPPGADPQCANVVGGHFYGQVAKVVSKLGNTITIEDGLSMDHAASTFRIRKLNMVQNVGIQDVMLVEDVVSGDITDYKILVRRAAGVWISGVESNYAKAHHFGVEYSTRVEIRGCYIHCSSNYAGSAGYSVYIGMRSTNCLVEDNIFTFHRHSVVLSGSPNRNVIGYNYSTESQYTGTPSEFVLHGFYPHANLFEGNVAGAMDIDQYWGWNGPFNTIFRNKFANWSIMSAPFINIVGNTAVSNPYPNPQGLLAANNSTTSVEPAFSHYYAAKPDFLSSKYTWPPIGALTSVSGPTLTQSIPAELRYNNGGQFTVNRRDPIAGYSIANTGLYSVFNGASGSGNIARSYRNPGELSIGGDGYYANSDLNWVAGPIATVMLASGQEEILSAYNYTHPTNKYATVYLSSGKNPNSQSLVFNMPNCVITALTTGDFNGDGTDEIVIAFLQNGLPRLYKSTTPTNLTQTLLYSNTSVYWTINALCTGDFDGNGNDELIIGMNSTGVDTRIFKSVNADGIGTAIYTHTSGYWRVGALAAIDSDGNGSDELIEGFNSSDGTAIYRSIGATTVAGLIHQFNSNYRVTAMAVGDMDNDGDEELVTGFNYTTPGTLNQGVTIYKSETVGKIDDVCIFDKKDLGMGLRSLVIEKIHPTAPGGRPAAPETQKTALSKHAAGELLISPNPASRILNIALTGTSEETQPVELYNSLGTLVMTGELQNGTGVLELPELKPGVYFIRVNTENGTLQEKVMIQ